MAEKIPFEMPNGKIMMVDEIFCPKCAPRARIGVLYAKDQSPEARAAGRKRIADTARMVMMRDDFGTGKPIPGITD